MDGTHLDSYLGKYPICDRCKRRIKHGDVVVQSFTGIVKLDMDTPLEPELGIDVDSGEYKLVHLDENCNALRLMS